MMLKRMQIIVNSMAIDVSVISAIANPNFNTLMTIIGVPSGGVPSKDVRVSILIQLKFTWPCA